MNNSSELKYELGYVIPQYKLLFGKSTTIDEVIDVASIALKAIGNKAQETFSYITKIENYKVKFPCDAYLIKSITKASPFTNYNLILPQAITPEQAGVIFSDELIVPENVFDSEGRVIGQITKAPEFSHSVLKKYNQNVVDKPMGEYVDFNNNGRDLLKFDVTGIFIEIQYKAPLLDEDNLPLVDEKTVTAICYYINYLDIQRKYFAKVTDFQTFQVARDLKNQHVVFARIGDVLTDNQTNKIFNHALSLNRKMYGLPLR